MPCEHGGGAMHGPMHEAMMAAGSRAAPPRHIGEVMAEVGRRFERMGNSVVVGRWELAAYDAEELGEVFAAEVPDAEPPPGVPLDLESTAKGFVNERLPALAAAAAARDRAAFDRAYASAAETCNACHRGASRGYIEIPSVPGESVPRTGAPGATPATAAPSTARPAAAPRAATPPTTMTAP